MRAIRMVVTSALVAIAMGLVSAAAFGLESDRSDQDGAPYTLRGLNLAADSGAPATDPPDEFTCLFAGTWTGGYFPAKHVTVMPDEHSGFTDWIVTVPFGFEGNSEDFEYVFVNRSTGKTTRTPSTSHVYPTAEDLAAGLDIYLCYRPRPDSIPEPEPEVVSTEPLTIRVTAPPGMTFTGNMLIVPGPGIARFTRGSLPVVLDGDASASVIIETGQAFPTVPLILPQFFGADDSGGGHVFTPVAIATVPNDRVGFVWTVRPSETVWQPVFRMEIADGGTFHFLGPRIFNAHDTQLITLNVLADSVPAGIGLDDVTLSIVDDSPLTEAPPAADIFQRGPSIVVQGGGGNDTLGIQSTLYNPTDNPVTLTNDSIGVALTDCETGVPFTTMRATLDQTLGPRSNTLINYNFEDRIDIGPGPLPEPPDPLSPTFVEDLEAWFGEICVQAESHPALTLP
jgi:hypothetical protein